MKVFRAERGDVFTSVDINDPQNEIWIYRNERCADLAYLIRDGEISFDDSPMMEYETRLTPAQVNAWAAANDIKIEWPYEQPATCKPDPVQPLSFREQAAIAAMQAMISCCRVNNLGVAHGDDFDSSYFNRETGMDHDTLRNEYDGCKEIAADAWVFADHLEAERIRRINGKDAT